MDHPFFVQGEGWVEVADMGPGDQLINGDGAPMLVKSIEAEGYDATTFNLTVANAHTFFVGEERIWVHNQNGPCNSPEGLSFGRNANQEHNVWRHVEDELGLDRLRVQEAILEDLPSLENLNDGLNIRFVTVDGVRLQYNAFKLADGSVNIGRIHATN